MSDFLQQLSRIENLREQISRHGKLPPEILKRIENRFRLECNYFSNRQEGGTLTREETRTVMIGNISVENKPLKDILEMKGHDEEMIKIMRIGQGALRISENRIRDIHRNIIFEEDPKKQKLVGQWKKDANAIYNSRGEKYSFTPPDEVPDKMHQLINWLGTEIEKIQRNDKTAIYPLVLAFDFHIRFLTIHPFHDGNGRTGRLLSNLLLVSYGYPPFYITDEEKDAYNRYLTDIQSYGGDPEVFYGFMIGLVARSMELSLDVIEGRDEYKDDWVKKLRLLKTESPPTPTMSIMKSKESIKTILKESIYPTIENIMEQMAQFDNLFASKSMWFGVENGAIKIEAKEELRKVIEENPPYRIVNFKYGLNGYKNALIPFGVSLELRWQLDDYAYSFSFLGQPVMVKLSYYYDHFYSSEDIHSIVDEAGRLLIQQIENK